MDALRVTKVEEVLCTKAGNTSSGTLHLTAHHAIFHFNEEEKEEMWTPYPLISLVSRMPMTIYGRCPLTLHTRTFETVFLSFTTEKDAIDVFESVKELTVTTSVSQLYAFFYVPNPPFAVSNGWSIYSTREEFGRMGVGTRSKAWRFTDINKDYSFSPTYPSRLVVPTRISDTTLQYAVKFRSKGRLPVLTYLHWANFGSITRSSQPMVGLTNNRSIQDEKLIETIFQTHHNPDSRVSAVPVYGATATNLIIDARPTTNAMANTAKGAGTENMDHYKDAKKAYLGIDHIHTMRESLNKVVEALRATEILQAAGMTAMDGGEDEQPLSPPVLDRQVLRRSGWLRHITAILEGTLLIVRNVHVNSSHVLIHCSDGWDRTAQLSSLAQLCLDPFYRTQKGFAILVEKDWLAFGHKFLDRCGHLSSEKFFLAPVENAGSGGGAEAAQAFLASVQNRFASQHHIKETSPVFHQFLEGVRQVQRQYPERFEFNERFLRQLHYHLYSCQFGSFLFNTERERRVGEGGQPPVTDRTISVWDYFNSPSEIELNKNPLYDPSLDDPTNRVPKADMGVLMPNPKDVRFWHELYGRTDEEMNGKFVLKQAFEEPEVAGPILSGSEDPALEQSQECIAISTPTPPPQPAVSPQLSIPTPQSIARLLQRGNSPLPATNAASSSTSPGDSPSTPETQRVRRESLQPPSSPGASSSSIALAPPRTPSPSVHAARSASPRAGLPSGQNAGDLFSSGGMRSLWGRVSSNATAAFSAVQDAYGGLAKDLKGLSLAGEGSDSARGGELKSRDEINAWGKGDDGDSRPSSPHRRPGSPRAHTYSSGNTINPWTTSVSRPAIPSMYMDNPWGSVRTPDRDARPMPFVSQGTQQETSSLPADPNVELPIAFPHSRSNTATQSQLAPGGARPSWVPANTDNPSGEMSSGANIIADAERRGDPSAHAASPSPPAQSPEASTASSDPLGVAVWS